jgi:hypothetical protein
MTLMLTPASLNTICSVDLTCSSAIPKGMDEQQTAVSQFLAAAVWREKACMSDSADMHMTDTT